MEKIFEYLEILKGWLMIGADYFRMLFTPELLPFLLAAIGAVVLLIIWGIFNKYLCLFTSFLLFAGGFLICFDVGFTILESGASGEAIFGVMPNLFWEMAIGFATIGYSIFYRVICRCLKKSKMPALLIKTLFPAAFFGAATSGIIILFMAFSWPYVLFIVLLACFIMYLAERLWLM